MFGLLRKADRPTNGARVGLKSQLMQIGLQPRIGRFRRNSGLRAAVPDPLQEKCEKPKFPVDAFWQKPYRPARNSTSQILIADNLTQTFLPLASEPL